MTFRKMGDLKNRTKSFPQNNTMRSHDILLCNCMATKFSSLLPLYMPLQSQGLLPVQSQGSTFNHLQFGP